MPQRTPQGRAETRVSILAMDLQGHLTIPHPGFDDDVRVSIQDSCCKFEIVSAANTPFPFDLPQWVLYIVTYF